MDLLEAILIFSIGLVFITIAIHMKLRVFGNPIKLDWTTIYTKTIPNHTSSVDLIKNYTFKSKNKSEKIK